MGLKIEISNHSQSNYVAPQCIKTNGVASFLQSITHLNNRYSIYNWIYEVMAKSSRSYIIILNWNCWPDTIECLESIFRNDAKRYQVIVCDNDSRDDSIDCIKAWAEGRLDVWLPPSAPLRGLSYPPVKKPIRYTEYQRIAAEAGGSANQDEPPMVLIHTGGNLGFAGGNNIGLRYALARDDFDYVWLINNDTVIKPDALTKLTTRIEEVPAAGICGSKLLYYTMPDIVQAWGGSKYNKWMGTTHRLGELSSVREQVDCDMVESNLDFISGAAMLVSKPFLKQIGLMEEEYFLYFEELDWATRAKGRFGLCFAHDSIVYHKEGSSIGTNSIKPGTKSLTADYYGLRSRLIFTRRFFPYCLPSIYIWLLPVLINRIRRGQWKRVRMVWGLAQNGLPRPGDDL